MGNDVLRVEANQRIDLSDFQFMIDESQRESQRHMGGNFLVTPSGSVQWVLDGFGLTNPAGNQITVTKGRALLSLIEEGVVYDGMLTSEGDASRTIDVSLPTYAAGVWNIYVRFAFIDDASGSRVFWSPSGTGSEFVKSIATRRAANWELRVESSSPGAEWLQLGTIDTTGPVVVADQRPLYFEGDVHNSYQSGWSSDGGGGAFDRNSDRQQYGVKDLQGFTAAMRQSLEDIKGRGLRRWWSRDIGGMNIGFDAAPVEGRLAVGDANFYLDILTADPTIVFEASSFLSYDRTLNEFEFQIAGGREQLISAAGVNIADGLVVGDLSITPTAGRLTISDTGLDGNFYLYHDTLAPTMVFDALDYLRYNRTSGTSGLGQYGFYINSSLEMALDASGLNVSNGLVVGNTGITPVNDRITLGDATFYLGLTGTVPVLLFDTGDYIAYQRTLGDAGNGEFRFAINSTDEMILDDTGLKIVNGLNVGFISAAIDDSVHVGDTQFGLVYNSGNPYITFETGATLLYTRGTDTFTLNQKIEIDGGMDLGFITDTPTSGSLRIFDTNFRIEGHASAPKIHFDWAAVDVLQYNRTSNEFDFFISATSYLNISTGGISSDNITADNYKVGSTTESVVMNPMHGKAEDGVEAEVLSGTSTSVFWLQINTAGGDGAATRVRYSMPLILPKGATITACYWSMYNGGATRDYNMHLKRFDFDTALTGSGGAGTLVASLGDTSVAVNTASTLTKTGLSESVADDNIYCLELWSNDNAAGGSHMIGPVKIVYTLTDQTRFR